MTPCEDAPRIESMIDDGSVVQSALPVSHSAGTISSSWHMVSNPSSGRSGSLAPVQGAHGTEGGGEGGGEEASGGGPAKTSWTGGDAAKIGASAEQGVECSQNSMGGRQVLQGGVGVVLRKDIMKGMVMCVCVGRWLCR